MKQSASDYRTPLRRARGLGPAKTGVMHWWLQRVTAVALIPLSLWFVSALVSLTQSSDPFLLVDWLSEPLHALPLLALVVALFWHAKLGMQVVIEDYVHAPFWKYTLLLANTFFCWGAGIACVLAVVRLHLFSLVTGV